MVAGFIFIIVMGLLVMTSVSWYENYRGRGPTVNFDIINTFC